MGLAFAFVAPAGHAIAYTSPSFRLQIGDRYRGPDMGFTREPNAVSIPGREGVYYVQDADNDVYRYNNTWYMNYNGDWYRASTYSGPWTFVGYRSVPREVCTVPTGYRTGWSDYRDTHYDWNRPDSYSDNNSGDTYSNTTSGATLRIGDRYRGPDLGFYNEPRVYPVRGSSGVYYVRDNNHDVYRYGNSWYMNYNGDWYRANNYRGPWVFVGYRSVPREIYMVPTQYRRNWRNYHDRHYTGRDRNWRNGGRGRYGDNGANVTLRMGDRYRGPNMGFTDMPNMMRVPGRGVYYVQDSDYDVYRTGNYWYMNYNGDWYRADSYRGPWMFVGFRSVPRDVYTVPTQYRRGWSDYRDRHYMSSAEDNASYGSDNGYYRDDNTYRDNGSGASVSLRLGQRYNGPDLGFDGEPQVVSVPGARGVYYVQDANNDVYHYGNNWYMNYNGDWYRAGSYDGPWAFVGYRSVPREVYSVPSSYRRNWTDYRDQHYDWNGDGQ